MIASTMLEAWQEKACGSERAVSIFLQRGPRLFGAAAHERRIENTWQDRHEARWQLVGVPGDVHSVMLPRAVTQRAVDVLRALPQIAAIAGANFWVFDLRLRTGGTRVEGRAHIARRALERSPVSGLRGWQVVEGHHFEACELVGIEGARFVLAGLARTAGLL